jgi:hypothetical protein
MVIEAEHACEPPSAILETPHVHESSKGAGVGTSLIKAMHAHLNRAVAFNRIDAQTTRN